MATTKEYRLGEFTYPRGWFMIADSEELNQPKAVAVRFFGRDFVIYRGKASGKAILLDAYCPHMKTHLAKNTTSYVMIDGGGTNIEGDSIRCPYHAWRFNSAGKCDDIPYHTGPIPEAACVKSWTVREEMGAVWIWYDPENGEPEWDLPVRSEWNDPQWVRWQYDHLGLLNQHPQEVVDNIADYGHLSPIHGSTVQKYENEFKGHVATQRQCGPHRTLVGADGVSPILHTLTSYHGPGMLISDMTGYAEAILMITHTPVDDGVIKVWHALMVKSANKEATVTDTIDARAFQVASRLAFEQDFEVWANKEACLNGMFIPSDGPFARVRLWYKQFFNPRANKQEFLDRSEGYYIPQGATPYTDGVAK
ncbi:Rieske (2Fe-2S) protein [Polynucleobacter sp. 30F-ANTBAC]|jgi:3-ketosteroid 9alpha-monooxygenase subunit A|uniref:Rieske 2Fe-2S domain-containing protein n=1 Tax=Polynucleobacter sp. 30F-ANTBAC TaxID=2689095 RepID=UPI001C0ACC92|nr:Rieske 2Fe-2S domain-containing protein [Polynucleobacter sp. 30F-ANTBAC]MBU3600471.1 Rieske (2Fe-2S) protein [Polynucleobacter sp. 30F-ANTBAC]